MESGSETGNLCDRRQGRNALRTEADHSGRTDPGAGLTKEQYRGADLEQFIEDFAITEEDVDTLNIPLLLEEYEPDRKDGLIDVSYLIEDDIEKRTSDFTENVYAIAFMENKNTSTECVYYDLRIENDIKRRRRISLMICTRQSQSIMRTDSKWWRRWISTRVFSWESGTDEEEITDPQYSGTGSGI